MEAKQRLDEYVKVMQSQKKLPTTNSGDLIESLVEFLQDPEQWEAGVQYLLQFPAMPVAQSFVRVYRDASEEGRTKWLDTWLSLTQDNRVMAPQRQLYVVTKLFPLDKVGAWKLIVDLCLKLTDHNDKVLTAERTIKIFNKELLSSSLLFMYQLDTVQPTKEEFVALASCVLHVLAWESNTEWELIQSEVDRSLNWLEQYPLDYSFPRVQKQSLEKSTMGWPNEYKERLLKLGFLESVVYVSRLEPNVEIPPLPLETFDLEMWVEGLRRNWEALEAYGHASARLQNERDSERRARLQVEENLVVADEKWKSALAHATNLEREVEALRSELRMKEEAVRQAQAEFEQEKIKLTDLTEHESQVVAEQFKNKLSQRLRFEYQDFSEIVDEPMTVELGNNLRDQLTGIFEVLQKQGIKL